MTEREALEKALAKLREIEREQAGPFFPGKTDKLRKVWLPELREIIKEGLGEEGKA